ncbi:hypothetical protein ACFY0A_33305 [Streptomyces sp. NPDC001698]|uniref:hypothetical protein n=1 Tax=Streptomyces sp. NPDC001698 TaxID=3364601 RepID=UPI00367C9C75
MGDHQYPDSTRPRTAAERPPSGGTARRPRCPRGQGRPDRGAIGAWKGAEAALEAAGVSVDAPGVILGAGGPAMLEEIISLLGAHRVWERFPAGA